MGDMKTPDFDDLLAAFDIPDIDAKEAIQSADEAEGPHGPGSAPLGKPDGGVGVGPSLRPSSPPDPQADTPIVSVIVKNRVRPDNMGGGDGDTDQDTMDSIAGVAVGPRLGACAPGMAESEPLNHNGFAAAGVTLPLTQAQAQSNEEPWSVCTPKTEGGGGGAGSTKSVKQVGNIFNRLKPLMAQGSGDPVGRARKMQLLQHQQQHTQQEADKEGGDEGKASLSSSSSAVSAPLVPGVSVGLSSPFFLPSKPLLPSPPSALSSHPLHSSQPFNGAPKAGPALLCPQGSQGDDSDPDLGPPLLIQEHPDSPSRTPPKLICSFRSPAGSSDSTRPMASSAAHPKPGDTPSGSSVTSSTPQSGSTKSLPQEDKHPEHVIEERDSPESPEPEIPKSASPVTAKRCSSPAVASTPPPSDLQEPKEEEEEMEVGNGIEKAMDGKADFGKEEGARTGEEKMEVDDCKSKPPATEGGTSTPGGPAAPARPLKVRIKTIKTSTGGITRTVTRVAPKAGAAGAKGLEPSKAPPGGRKTPANRAWKPDTASGRMAASQPQKAKSLKTLPVSTLAASTAMLAAATKAQSKMAASSDKAKVSATAVSITKSAALPATPSVASSPKFSVATGGMSVRPVGAKTTNGGSASVLAGTHQPNKPASIVNSTGAVISRSQSSLVEAFNKILNSKNLLPSYKPDLSAAPPPEWGLPLPATGYRCLECGDAFALERSLARHYDRRSLRIEVTCNHCAKRLAFFNKCSLLLHAREHKERGLVMQCSHLVMRPVTVEQMIGQQDTTPIVSSPSTTSGAPAVSSSSSPMKDTQSPSAAQLRPVRHAPQSPQALMPLPIKKGEVLQYNNFKCPECQAQFSGKAELVAHFQQIRATPNSTCTLCSPPMMLPNWCSVSAHQRIHKHRAPHVCPECGGIARQASFQTHLEEACLHFARRIGYRCSSCQVVFGGLNSIKSHIQTAHCEVFHKCPSCPMAFKSAPSAQGHISTQHPTLTGGQAKLIYKCVMCDTVFTQKPLLYMHFDTHLAKQKVHVFKCPDCTKLYAQKGSMMEHTKTAHRRLSVKQEGQSNASAPAPAPTNTSAPTNPSAPSAPSLPKSKPSAKKDNSDGEDWGRDEEEEEEEGGEEEGDEDYEEPENQSSSVGVGSHRGTTSEWSCQQCQKSFTKSDDYISHMKTEHGKAMKKFPCCVCESSFSTSSSLRRHVRIIHEGNKRVFHCQYCTQGKRTFSSQLILEKHIQVHHHGVRATDEQGSPQTRKRSAPGTGPGSSSEPDGEGGPPGDEEGTDSGEATEEGGEEGSNPVKRTRASAPPEPEEDDGVFRCVPCGFATEDGAEFQRHIPQHRADAASFQCLQCGVCFASAGSLGRHRFITHRVRDPQGESNHRPPRTPSSPDGLPSSPQEGEDGKGSMSCRVCSRHFDRASDLNTHLRTHGMAFISAHKTDKPQ
ncbi:zinc finger protein 687b isoform X2 [Coregonus clupeaformis]|uniref:zinc finger protein 687b isoform X2 n=1 Tax=Coregonus clupeaformis TaxID=59861 RepID=UPI001BE07364|nr:zinc finger protein 687b isoform X2 [Coregonus clupeaformis]